MRIEDYLTMLSGVFFMAFFIPLLSAGGFALSLNFLSVICLTCVSLIHIKRIISNPLVSFGIVGPWLIMLMLYILSLALLTPRSSFGAFLAQFMFMISSIGLAFQVQQWLQQDGGHKMILSFCLISFLSFFIFIGLYAPTDAIFNLLAKIASLDPISVVYYSRRVFAPDMFFGDQSLADLSSYQNRIAQHLFSHAYLIFCLILLSNGKNTKTGAASLVVIFFCSALVFFAVLLLSGQTLGQILVTIIFFVTAMALYRMSYGLLVKISFVSCLVGGALMLLSSTDLWEKWSERFTSGNIDTGRSDRWGYYFTETTDFTPIGLFKSITLDPHNLYVGALFEIGAMGLFISMLFAAFILAMSLLGLRSGIKNMGYVYILCVASGIQLIFITFVSGGWGFPGWAGWSKFTLFIVAIIISPAKYVVWNARGMPPTNRERDLQRSVSLPFERGSKV